MGETKYLPTNTGLDSGKTHLITDGYFEPRSAELKESANCANYRIGKNIKNFKMQPARKLNVKSFFDLLQIRCKTTH